MSGINEGFPQAVTLLRALSHSWVLVFHTMIFSSNYFLLNAVRNANPAKSPNTLVDIIFSGPLGVDIFFMLSAILATRKLLSEKQPQKYHHYLIHRIIRLAPMFYISCAFSLLFDHFNWQNVWANLLFVSNLLPVTKMYHEVSWSVCVDMQLSAVLPFVLLFLQRPTFKNSKFARRAFVAFVAIFTVALTARGLYPDLPGGLWKKASGHIFAHPLEVFDYENARLLRAEVDKHYFAVHYSQPHTRFVAYLCGIVLAMEYHELTASTSPSSEAAATTQPSSSTHFDMFTPKSSNHNQKRLKSPPQPSSILLFLLSLAVVSFFIAFPYLNLENDIYVLVWHSMWHPCFSVGASYLVWLIMTNAHKVNSRDTPRLHRLMYWKGWTFISTLSYANYLTHALPMFLVCFGLDPILENLLGRMSMLRFAITVLAQLPLCFAFAYFFHHYTAVPLEKKVREFAERKAWIPLSSSAHNRLTKPRQATD